MKILKTVFIAIAVFGLTGCSSDDDNNSVELTIDNLEGTYEITFLQESYEEVNTSSSGNTSIVETGTFTGDTFTNSLFVFNASGTFVSSGSFRLNSSITNDSGTQTDSQIEDLASSGSYTINTASWTITIEGQVYDVVLFDGTNLWLNATYSDTVPGGNTQNITEELRFVKQN